MNITIVGAGNMGAALLKQLTRAGHTVRITARDEAKVQALAAAHPGAIAASVHDALADSTVVIVATGYQDAVPALRSLGFLKDRVVIDITNPLAADFMSLTIGHDTSAAEEIAKAIPEADVVKAFNTVFAQVLSDGPRFGDGQIAPVFIAGESARAKEITKVIVESIGFLPIDAGGLKNAR